MVVTWNPADCSPNITLSNGNTTATKGPDGEYSGVRGTVSYSTGLRYCEATVPSDNEGSVGLATASEALDAPLGYGSLEGVGMYDDGTVWMEYNYSLASGSFGDTRVGFLVDLDARLLWVKDSTGAWIHGGDPAASGEGLDISMLTGPLFPMMCGHFLNDTSTIYGTPETITLGLPAGATAWGDDGSGTPELPRKAIRSIFWFSAPGEVVEEPDDLTKIRWTMDGLTSPIPASNPAFPDATLYGANATANGTNVVLNQHDYIEVVSPVFGLPIETYQQPSVARISFNGIANTAESTILLDMFEWAVSQVALEVPWMLNVLRVTNMRQGPSGEEWEQIDSDVGDLKIGTNALYEVEWTDDPQGTGGTFRFYVDGVQLGADKPSQYKLRLSDGMDVSVNASLGNTSSSRNGVEVEYIEVGYKA